MAVHKRIDTLIDVGSAAFVTPQAGNVGIIKRIQELLGGIDSPVFERGTDLAAWALRTPPDVVFVGPTGQSDRKEKFALCRQLRGEGFEGLVILIADDETECSDTQSIMAEGFDNYFLKSSRGERIADAIQWAISNRRRRNKYSIQFDASRDMLFTVDRTGRVFDINLRATEGSKMSPKELVIGNRCVTELKTLTCFDDVISPLITAENVGKEFTTTIDDVETVYQVRTRVHNVSIIGLTATVVKTDITNTIYSHTMDVLANSITLLSHRDNYTASHSSRVFMYAKRIARALGYDKSRKFKRTLYVASLLHDIGKIGIKDSILLKPGKLTGNEFSELAGHSVKGYKMLQPYRFLLDASELVRFHHERPDGSGYPDKLRGEKIPLGASIIAVADGFDAMTTERPYRRALSVEKAAAELRNNMGTQFHKGAGSTLLSMVTPQLVEETRSAAKRPMAAISAEVLESVLNP